jgi:hypothetical protein
VAGRIRYIEKIHLIGTRIRDLPTCSIVPQPTTLPRAPIIIHNTVSRMRVLIRRTYMYTHTYVCVCASVCIYVHAPSFVNSF